MVSFQPVGTRYDDDGQAIPHRRPKSPDDRPIELPVPGFTERGGDGNGLAHTERGGPCCRAKTSEFAVRLREIQRHGHILSIAHHASPYRYLSHKVVSPIPIFYGGKSPSLFPARKSKAPSPPWQKFPSLKHLATLA